MHNKKIIAKGLIVSILLLNAPTDAMADTIENYKLSVVDKEYDNSLKESKFEEFFNNLFTKFKQPKDVVKVNKNIKIGTVKEITLSDGQIVPNLDGNPDGYETIRVTTIGHKKLVKEDYDNLRTSGIPKVDLSNSSSDEVPTGAFTNATYLTEFKFPKGIKSIGDDAFENCYNLTGDLIIPDGVTSIGGSAFYKCSGFTGDLMIPNGVITIGDFAFYECSGFTGDLIIPNSVTKIGHSAFTKCTGFDGKLKISENITSIDKYTFMGCSGLTGDLIIPNGISSIGTQSFEGCENFNGKLIIPDSVLEIKSRAFSGCSGLTGDLIIPNSVTEIGNGVFGGCSGFSGNLILPSNLKAIHHYAFSGCSGLTGDLIIPNSVTLIGDSAFENCTGFNGNLVISNSITSISRGVFNGCSGLTGDLIIPDSIAEIGSGAFRNCAGFTGDLIIPSNVTKIEDSAFEGCSGFNGSLILHDTLTLIGRSAFYECSGFTGDLIIPNNITKIESSTFKGCSGFTGNLVIPNTVIEIGKFAFDNLNNVNKIIIKVNSEDLDTNYKENIINNLPNTTQTLIDLPYNFNTTGTWLENTERTIGKPVIKNIVGGEEVDINSGETGQKVSLHIPAAYDEEDVIVLKDGKPYKLPTINEDKKYIFDETGTYEINITTTLGNVSNISFTVEDPRIEQAVSKAEESQNPADIEAARDLVNSLPESIQKDDFQDRLDTILPNIEFETKTATANLDIYIKSENLLSLSLNTNSVTFEDFSGVEDDEKLNALTLTVNSSLPYDIKAYLPEEIAGSKYGESLDKSIFNIRANEELEYQTFENTETPIILLSEQEAGNNNNHGIDLKLASDLAYKSDIYKATVKFEVEQK